MTEDPPVSAVGNRPIRGELIGARYESLETWQAVSLIG